MCFYLRYKYGLKYRLCKMNDWVNHEWVKQAEVDFSLMKCFWGLKDCDGERRYLYLICLKYLWPTVHSGSNPFLTQLPVVLPSGMPSNYSHQCTILKGFAFFVWMSKLISE